MLTLALAVTAGAAARFARLELRSFWLDEAFSVEVASQPLGSLLHGQVADAHTPPLYYILLHGWLQLGTSDAWLRGLSALASLAALGVLAWGLGRTPLPWGTRWLVGVTIAMSPFQVFFAQEARMYSLAMALALGIFFLEEAAARGARWPTHLALAAVGGLGLYCHYYLAFVIAGSALWRGSRLLGRRGSGDNPTAWLLPHLGMLALFAPWLGVVWSLAGSAGQTFRSQPWAVLGYAVFRFVLGYGALPHNVALKASPLATTLAAWPWLLALGVLLTLGAAGFLLSVRRSGETATAVTVHHAWWVVGTTFLAPLLLSIRIPMYSERYLGVVQPLVILLLAVGLLALPERMAGVGATLLVALSLAGTGLWLAGAGGKERWRDAAALISAGLRPADTVVADPSYTRPALARYLPPSGPELVGVAATGSPGMVGCVDGRLLPTGRVWVTLSHATRQPEDWEAALAPCASLELREDFEDGVGVTVLRFDSTQ